MDEEKRKLILIAVLGGILLLLIIFMIWWFLRPKAEPELTDVVEEELLFDPTLSETPAVPQSAETPRIIQEEIYPLGLRQLAMSFAERYASYSTDEPSKNIEDLEVFMTPELYEELKEQDLTQDSGTFVGFSARALTYQLVESDDSTAEIVVGLQVNQSIDSAENVYTGNLELTAKKINNEWKIDDVNWQ